jgi:translation initiation factor 2 alpha subunit (eIF-2alpha)
LATNSEAPSKVKSAAELFKVLRKNFAQKSHSLEDAYLEIAEKLMELSDDTYDTLEVCTRAVDDGRYG